jgi:hypothetical protein
MIGGTRTAMSGSSRPTGATRSNIGMTFKTCSGSPGASGARRAQPRRRRLDHHGGAGRDRTGRRIRKGAQVGDALIVMPRMRAR